MDNEILNVIKDVAVKIAHSIYVIDVMNDELDMYSVSNQIDLKGKDTLSNFLEKAKLKVDKDYLSSYMGMFSIPKIQDEIKNGKDYVKYRYKTVSGNYINIISFLSNNKIIVLEYESSKDNKIINNAKYNSLIEALSSSILKINNAFNVDDKTDIKRIEKYINSVLFTLTNNYPDLKKEFNNEALNVSSSSIDTILIVDDDMLTRNMIKKIFDGQYKIAMASNGKEAIEYFEANKSNNGLNAKDNVLGVFLDLTMPVMDGFAVLEYLNSNNYLSKIPVIIISGDYEKETKMRVYNYNIADMLEKPFDFEVVKHRISNFINLYKSSNSLNELINDQNDDLKDLIQPFVSTYEYDYKDNIKNISSYIKILGKKVMEDYPEYGLNEDLVNKMADSSKYYDIGFYSVPKRILNKKNLDENDMKLIKDYPIKGANMIKYLLSLTSDEIYKKYANNIACYYHENYDGTGYPSNLKEDNIPVEAQIASLAITYNNLKNKNINDIKDIILRNSGTIFNPKIVGSFMKVENEFINIK